MKTRNASRQTRLLMVSNNPVILARWIMDIIFCWHRPLVPLWLITELKSTGCNLHVKNLWEPGMAPRWACRMNLVRTPTRAMSLCSQWTLIKSHAPEADVRPRGMHNELTPRSHRCYADLFALNLDENTRTEFVQRHKFKACADPGERGVLIIQSFPNTFGGVWVILGTIKSTQILLDQPVWEHKGGFERSDGRKVPPPSGSTSAGRPLLRHSSAEWLMDSHAERSVSQHSMMRRGAPGESGASLWLHRQPHSNTCVANKLISCRCETRPKRDTSQDVMFSGSRVTKFWGPPPIEQGGGVATLLLFGRQSWLFPCSVWSGSLASMLDLLEVIGATG